MCWSIKGIFCKGGKTAETALKELSDKFCEFEVKNADLRRRVDIAEVKAEAAISELAAIKKELQAGKAKKAEAEKKLTTKTTKTTTTAPGTSSEKATVIARNINSIEKSVAEITAKKKAAQKTK